jgi:hypothetical protein
LVSQITNPDLLIANADEYRTCAWSVLVKRRVLALEQEKILFEKSGLNPLIPSTHRRKSDIKNQGKKTLFQIFTDF